MKIIVIFKERNHTEYVISIVLYFMEQHNTREDVDVDVKVKGVMSRLPIIYLFIMKAKFEGVEPDLASPFRS